MFGVEGLSSAPREIIHHIADWLDIPSLLALRLVSSNMYSIVTIIFSNDRRRLLKHFVSEPDVLLSHMRRNRMVIGGEAALAFLLRDSSLFPDTLDLYADGKRYTYESRDDIADDPQLHLEPVERSGDLSPMKMAHCEDVFRTANGRLIKVFFSMHRFTVLEPIAAAWSSALINFVGTDTFACGYPLLTLRRRALSYPLRLLEETEQVVHSRLVSHGFEHNTTPTAWADYLSFLSPTERPHKPWGRVCMHQLYICPPQGRFFGDAGSLLVNFDPLHIDMLTLRNSRALPCGPTVAWRLDVELGCNGPCVDIDPILPEDIYVMTAVVLGNACRFRSTFQAMEML